MITIWKLIFDFCKDIEIKISIAKSLLKSELLSDEEIATVVEIPLEEIEQIKKDLELDADASDKQGD